MSSSFHVENPLGAYFNEVSVVMSVFRDDRRFHDRLLDAFEATAAALDAGAAFFMAGNGGGQSIAQHMAADISKSFSIHSFCLGVNQSLASAYANDKSFEEALLEEYGVLGTPCDVIWGFSVGGSKNITRLLTGAREIIEDTATVLITTKNADLGPLVDSVDHIIVIPTTSYEVGEDLFAIIAHSFKNFLMRS